MNGQNDALITLLALVGKAGAGKDTILRYLCDHYDVNEVISCTTRPPREGEVDGVNYHFLSESEFAEKVLNFDMLEATEFNGWFYGTDITALSPNKVNVGVFNPAGVEALMNETTLNIIPVLVEAKDKTRLLRQLNREESPNVKEIIRRYGADVEDFDVEFADLIADFGRCPNEDGQFPQNAQQLASLLHLGEVS